MVERSGTVVVTGAGSGLGREIAIHLARSGRTLLVADLSAEAARKTAAFIENFGQRSIAFAGDVTLPSILEQIFDLADAEGAGLEALVNNAGGGGERAPHFPLAAPEAWMAKLSLNLVAPMYATQLAMQRMDQRGGGAVVNIASSAGLGLAAYVSPEYAAAKAGLIRFTSCLAAHPSVGVSCIVPGWIATERALAELAEMNPAERAGAETPTPMKVLAEAVLHLVESRSRSILRFEGTKPPMELARVF